MNMPASPLLNSFFTQDRKLGKTQIPVMDIDVYAMLFYKEKC